MAGETSKSTALTAADEDKGKKRLSRLASGTVKSAMESEALIATQLETADLLLVFAEIPSNAIVRAIFLYNDDLDADGTPTLALDIGAFAAQEFVSITSGTKTRHAKNAVLDADLYVDGSTVAQAATTKWTRLDFDSATKGPDKAAKMVWEDLGYDEDPGAPIRIGITAATAAATGAAGDLAIMVEYLVD